MARRPRTADARARPAPIFDNSGWLPHSSNANVLIFDPEDISPVPLRPDMTDRHARGEASMLVGSGGGGKLDCRHELHSGGRIRKPRSNRAVVNRLVR